jgi:hypothetical protein
MAGGIKDQAYIDHLYYELGTGGVGTFTVTISYGNMEAQATILVTPPTDHNIQDQILSLGRRLGKEPNRLHYSHILRNRRSCLGHQICSAQ